MDIMQVAQQALDVIKPALMSVTGDVAIGVLGSGVYDWMKDKFAGAGRKDLVDAIEKNPTDDLNWDEAKFALARILRDNPELVKELQEMLAECGVGDSQTITGAVNSKIVQNQGDENTISIS